ncbi:hypothetical protein evm_003194 [Chilo suppressalis]|nr:hypothetical protein evm_003194 [Chilo suppressalis]
MDELKHRAGEKLEALHLAAITAADGGKNRVQDVFSQAAESIRKKERLEEALESLRMKQQILAEARAKLRELSEMIARLQKEYDEKVAQKEELERKSRMLQLKLERAEALITGLSGERERWELTVERLDKEFDNLPGDCLIATGFVAYLGPFVSEYREALMSDWFMEVYNESVPVTMDLTMKYFLLDDATLRDWNYMGLPGNYLLINTRVSKRPRTVTADGAATLPWAATAALTALESLNLSPENAKGKRVAICGAASGEGCVLVQLLSAWGAHLTVLAPRQAAMILQDLGAQEFVDSEEPGSCWRALEVAAARTGPWHCALACPGVLASAPANKQAILKATAPRNAIIDLRPQPFISDRLPTPLTFVYAVSFYTIRALRWVVGLGSHTDWLENRQRLRPGLENLAQLVDTGRLQPVLDKVFMPQDFESALAHACSEDAIGTTVIRFP